MAVSFPDGVDRLPAAVELLEAGRIRGALREESRRRIHRLEVLLETDSTNTRLLALPAPPADCADVLLCERQHAGRGRRGRTWRTPFGSGLAMSVGWAFREPARAQSSLSLAVGVAISRALERSGARGVRLKWPNDIWFEDRKMGGVLVELTSGATAHVVVGIGLNVSLSADSRREIEADGTRVAAVTEAAATTVSRNALAAVLVEEVLSMLQSFERRGFAAFRDEWQSLDALAGRPARVLRGDDAIEGVARGVDGDGALLLDSGGRLQKFVSGEVSLRGR